MAKAHIETPDGVSVKLEGTPAEIAAVLKEVKVKGNSKRASGASPVKAKGGKVTLPGLITDLKGEGYFKKTKNLGDVKERLAEIGHNYPSTALSGPMRELVRKKVLRRFKEGGKYVYAQ